ncbi:Cytochrome b5 [Dictyocoela muelleri]|nr:Cytochrome b5 [Dictyocoela muelleri]
MRKISWKELREKRYHLIHGKIYDLHNFKHQHPGGAEILEEHAGMDCSKAFDAIMHSQTAKEMMKNYLIGELLCEEETSSDNIVERPERDFDLRKWAMVGGLGFIYVYLMISYLFNKEEI